ncbi:unnamed protein product [Ceutorhynchus assimilis]|uniref:Macroglobulin domain-containing protein n=1 Tax=Ceutorhynchus assimilis TaxID=467358 RepID=A0A9N9MIZ4_9CUCU|nr:unnamed protein product [Ceutorhynchus assimilis]
MINIYTYIGITVFFYVYETIVNYALRPTIVTGYILKSHYTRKHCFSQATFNHHLTDDNVNNHLGDINTCNDEPVVNDVVSASVGDEINEIVNIKDLTEKAVSSLYLNLQAKHFLTDKALQTLISSFLDLSNIHSNFIVKKLESSGVASAVVDDVKKAFLFDNLHNRENGMLRTKYCRNNYYKKNFDYVEPKKVSVGFIGSKEHFFYYVPIIETLKCMLKNSNVFARCVASEAVNHQNDNCFSDITDGSCFKTSTFFNAPNRLRLILYQDAFEPCNPLGSAKTKYKIVGIYMLLANLHPWHRSQVEHIQLVSLSHEKDIKLFSFSKILEPLIDELKLLETAGFEFQGIHFRGFLIAVVGDNLGSHQIGGFVESFSTETRFCRYCDISKFPDRKNNNCLFGKLRTKENYECDANMASFNGISNGVKTNSVLNELQYFHVCLPGLPPCLAHDLLEGVVAIDTMVYLNYLVKQKKITYSEINKELDDLNFEFKPRQSFPPIKKSDKLGGNASQNLYVLNCLPFAMYTKANISRFEKAWVLLHKMRTIVNIVLSFNLTVEHIAFLKSLIFEYISERSVSFPDDKLKPKHHFLCHYPYLIKCFGPLRHLWTLRFESKHRYFKNIIKHSQNFINILKTMAEKHQYMQALNYGSNTDLLYSNSAYCDKDVEVYNEKDYPQYLVEHLREKYNPAGDPNDPHYGMDSTDSYNRNRDQYGQDAYNKDRDRSNQFGPDPYDNNQNGAYDYTPYRNPLVYGGEKIEHAAIIKEAIYFVVASKMVRPGQLYRVSVTVLKEKQPLIVRASISRNGVEMSTDHKDVKEGIPETLLMQVPTTSASGEYKLRVEGLYEDILEGVAFSNETKLTFSQRSMTIFIQLDKPVYNMQGETVRFRTIPINTELKAFNDAIDVYMLDPNGRILKRWLSRQSNLGTVSLDYQLSDQPAFGEWKIRAIAQESRSEESTFMIEEYYQTRFEVNVTMPAFFLNTELFITGIVMANYTSGAPVRGNLTLKASVRHIKPIDVNRMLKKNRPRPIESNLYNPYGPNDFWKQDDYHRRFGEDPYNR